MNPTLVLPNERGLRTRHLEALGHLVDAGSLDLKQASERMDLSAPSLSRLFNGLVRRQLALRRTDPADFRVVYFMPTQRGRKLSAVVRRRAAEDSRRFPETEDTTTTERSE